MKLILLNGAHGSGRDEAAKQLASILRKNFPIWSLDHALIWPVEYLGTDKSFEKSAGVSYVIVPNVDEPEQLIKAVQLVGVENVCLVNVFRPGYGGNTRPLGYDRQRPGERLEHLDFNLYNDGPLELLGGALAYIVEQWENGATFVELSRGRSYLCVDAGTGSPSSSDAR